MTRNPDLKRLIALFSLLVAASVARGTDPPSSAHTVASSDPIVVCNRQRLEASYRAHMDPIDARLHAIQAPSRRVPVAALGLPASPDISARVQVVGALSDDELGRLMPTVSLQTLPWKIVGDLHYARLYFGRPGIDPCCFEEWTYVRDRGEWRRIDLRGYSH